MKMEVRAEQQLQEGDVEEVAVDGVVAGDGIPEPDSLIVLRTVDPLIVEKVGKVFIEELHQLRHVHLSCFPRPLRHILPRPDLVPNAAAPHGPQLRPPPTPSAGTRPPSTGNSDPDAAYSGVRTPGPRPDGGEWPEDLAG